jgi:hypothetical protein
MFHIPTLVEQDSNKQFYSSSASNFVICTCLPSFFEIQ